MDNTEKVENAINQYLETEDASYLTKVLGTTSTDPFGDSDLGYCIARGDLADVISRIKKITNFSDLLAEEIKLSDLDPKEQLEMTDKTVVTEKSDNEIEDEDSLVTEEFSEEGAIGNQITDYDTPKEQLELDDKVFINKNADVDDNEDFVVAEFSDLNFSDDESLPTIETSGSALDKIAEILNIAKELESIDNSNTIEEESIDDSEDIDEDDLGEDDLDEDDLDSEEFSIKREFRTNVEKEVNFTKNLKVDNPILKDLYEGAEKYTTQVRHAKSYDDVESIEKKFKRFIKDKLENYSNIINTVTNAENFDNSTTTEKSRAQLDSEMAQKRIDEGTGSKKANYIEDQLNTIKKYDKPGLLGGSEDAKKLKPALEREKQALANGGDTKFWNDYKARADEEVKAEEEANKNSDFAKVINSSFLENLKKELKLK